MQLKQALTSAIARLKADDVPSPRMNAELLLMFTLNCDRAYLSETYLDEGLAEGLYVFLEVADTGCGISAGDKEKLFLPYFSTKGRGTGLGLAIVNHILSEHHARIRVEDNRPAGARFYVEVPATVVVETEVRA